MSQIATAADLKKAKGQEVELPSGVVVKLRRPGMEKFLSAGFFPDSMAKEVSTLIASKGGQQMPTQDEMVQKMSAMVTDVKGLQSMTRMLDRVAAYCFVQPAVLWHERPKKDTNGNPIVDADGQPELEDIPQSERRDEDVYTDDLELEDKIFILHFSTGGTVDLATFRKEWRSSMDAVQASGSVVDTAE